MSVDCSVRLSERERELGPKFYSGRYLTPTVDRLVEVWMDNRKLALPVFFVAVGLNVKNRFRVISILCGALCPPPLPPPPLRFSQFGR